MHNDCFSPLSLFIAYFNVESLEATCRVLLGDSVAKQSMAVEIYLLIFLLTCALEAPIYVFGLSKSLSPRQIVVAIFSLNLATHPLVTWVFPWIFAQSNILTRDYLCVSELFAIVVEALLLVYLFKIKTGRAWIISGCANLFSWWSGLYLAPLLGIR